MRRCRRRPKTCWPLAAIHLFGLIDRAALEQIINLDPTTLQPLDRARVERVLDLSVWLDMYHPEIIF